MRRDIDLQVSRAIFSVKLLERALHDPGPWAFAWGPLIVPAEREVTDSGVVLRGDCPEHCLVATPGNVVALLCNGEVVGAKEIDPPGDGGFEVEWSLSARIAVAA